MYVEWPRGVDEATRKCLGSNLQGLDPLRLEFECHIVFTEDGLDNHPPGFAVLGDRESSMLKAVHCLRNLEKTIFARQMQSHRYYLVKPFPPSELTTGIRIDDYFKPAVVSASETNPAGALMLLNQAKDGFVGTNAMTNILTLNQTGARGNILIGHPSAKHINALYCEAWVMPRLDILRSRQGGIEMRIDIGSCVFASYKEELSGTDQMDVFKDMLRTQNTSPKGLETFFTEE
jgi:hypothetical protein